MKPEVRIREVNPEAFNICRSNLVKSIKCDVPCSDGYGPSNLIASNFFENSKGFLAERFIKPPVSLTVEFKNEINVDYIAVTCGVGAQKSKGIELFTQSVATKNIYESVASGVLPDDDKNGFVFHRFNIKVSDKFGERYCYRTFKSSRFLSAVSNMKIKIFRTCGTCVPALGKFEIWGTPVKSACFELSRSIASQAQTRPLASKTAENCNKPTGSFRASEPSTSKSLPLSSTRAKHNDEKCVVPDDFIDPITCEVMIQPVILPSGKVVDSSTLKAHEKAELKWGRGPSDPFTGIPFSESNRPVAAPDLKCRIDKFLTDNCNMRELQSIPRTLGGSSYQAIKKLNPGVSVSKLVVSSGSTLKVKSQDLSNKNYSLPTDRVEINIGVISKRRLSQTDVDTRTHSSFKYADSKKKLGSSAISQTSVVNQEEDRRSKKLRLPSEAVLSFQERMDQSLEQSLKSTLSKLPKFTSSVKVDSSELTTVVLCYACKSLEHLFSIPCSHYVCRLCLLRVKKAEVPSLCQSCSLEYKVSDVHKVHVR